MGATCSKDEAATDGSNASPHNHHHNYHHYHHSHPYHHDNLSAPQQQQPPKRDGWAGSCMSSCSAIDQAVDPRMDSCRADAIDPVMYDLCRKSLTMTLQDAENKAKEQQESAPPVHPSSSHLHHHQQQSTSSSSKKKQHLHHQQQQQLQHQQQQNSFIGQYHLLYKHQSRTGTSADTTTTATSSGGGGDVHHNTTTCAVAGGDEISTAPTTSPYSTRLIVRRRPIAAAEEGTHGTHLYAIRYPADDVVESKKVMAGSNTDSSRPQEQCPNNNNTSSAQQMAVAVGQGRGGQREKKKRHYHHSSSSSGAAVTLDPTAEPVPEPPKPSPAVPTPQLPTEALQDFFQPAKMRQPKASTQTIQEWVTVSEEHCIYVVDVGLTPAQCDRIVQVTEQVCRGQYAAYTYAKQTLGCREFPILAQACAPPVQSVVQAILGLPSSKARSSSSTVSHNRNGGASTSATLQPPQHLQLDDREPHLVKYDVTKKERQKLDMHTDKSEWTFLIALSNGCGLDYDGGGTYFECLNATIHIQRGHALIFPGKLRHCGQRITRGLRYLLVGFLVDKAHLVPANNSNNNAATSNAAKGQKEDDKNNNNNKTNSSSSISSGAISPGTSPVLAKSLTSGRPVTIGGIIST